MILCSYLTGLTLATPILIGQPVLYWFKYLVATVSWMVYLAMLLYILNLLLLDPIFKEVDHSAIAWFTLVYPVEPLDAMRVYGTLAGGESRDA